MKKDILILIGIGAGIYFLNKNNSVNGINGIIQKGSIILHKKVYGTDPELWDKKAIVLDFGSKYHGGYLIEFLDSKRRAIVFRKDIETIEGIEKHLDQKSHNVNIKIGSTQKQFVKMMKAQKKQIEIAKKINEKFTNWSYPIPPVNTLFWSFNDWSNWINKYGIKN